MVTVFCLLVRQPRWLCHKSEGRWFDPKRCHWNFSFT